jgi:hypothetical protein
VARAEELDLRPGHQCRADELFGAPFVVIAVDEDDTGSQADEGGSPAFVRLRKVSTVSGEFDGSTKQRGGERVGGEDQNVVTAHVVIDDRVRGATSVLGEPTAASKRGAKPDRRRGTFRA